MTKDNVEARVRDTLRLVVAQTPRAFGVALDHWTVRTLRRYLKETGLECSNTTVHKGLKDIGAKHVPLAGRTPASRATTAARQIIKAAMETENGWFADETRIAVGAFARGYWLSPHLVSPLRVLPMDWTCVHVIGALHTSGSLVYEVLDTGPTGGDFVRFVRKLLSAPCSQVQGPEACVVADSASIHSCRLCVTELDKRLTLLPARTGALNPVEHVWVLLQGQLAHQNWGPRIQMKTKVSLALACVAARSAALQAIVKSYASALVPF